MLDIIILVILLVGFFIGLKRGLFKQMMRFVGTILSLLIAYLFADSASSVIALIISAPDVNEVPILNLLNATTGMVDTVFYRLIAFLLLFLLAKITIAILTHVLNVAGKIPVVKQANSLLGGMFGVVEVYLFLFVVLIIGSYLPIGEIQTHIGSSILAEPLVNLGVTIFSGLIQNFLT